MDPPVIVHAYVAPVPADATDATFPVELAETVAGAVMVPTGFALTVTFVLAEVAPQPAAFLTVTEYEPADVTVIACVVAPFDQR